MFLVLPFEWIWSSIFHKNYGLTWEKAAVLKTLLRKKYNFRNECFNHHNLKYRLGRCWRWILQTTFFVDKFVVLLTVLAMYVTIDSLTSHNIIVQHQHPKIGTSFKSRSLFSVSEFSTIKYFHGKNFEFNPFWLWSFWDKLSDNFKIRAIKLAEIILRAFFEAAFEILDSKPRKTDCQSIQDNWSILKERMSVINPWLMVISYY